MPAQPSPHRTVLNRSDRSPLLAVVAFFVVIGLASCGYSSTSPADSANTAAAQLESGLNLSQKAIPDFKAWQARESESANVPAPPLAITTAPKSEYPKEVSLSSVDNRFRTWLGSDRGKTVAVQLAPGVYTERSTSGDLGTLEDYSAYVGLCVDVKRYAELHPGGYTCW